MYEHNYVVSINARHARFPIFRPFFFSSLRLTAILPDGTRYVFYVRITSLQLYSKDLLIDCQLIITKHALVK